MQIGIGLPNPIPGTPGNVLVEWARRAEARGFSSLATIDRIAYPSYEPLIALSAAGAVTSRIGLMTNILLTPTRSPILLAKMAAGVDQISRGRLTLGLGVGSREDDFIAVEMDFKTRGKRMDRDLELMHQAWKGEPVAGSSKAITPIPVKDQRVPVLIGGTADESFARMARWGVGWTVGGGGPERAAPFLDKARQAWREAGHTGSPHLVALTYFALGPNASAGEGYIMDYYGPAPFAQIMAKNLARTPEALRALAQQYADVGFDELIIDPTIADLNQVDLLADAVL